MSLTSFSRLQLHATCAGAAVLPQVETTSEPAARGLALHDYLATAGKLGREAALARVPEKWQPVAEAIDLDRLPACDPASYAAEVALAYDVQADTARELGRGGGRNYADLRGHEIPGTLDTVGLTADGAGVVLVEYKAGRKAVPAARVNWQVRVGALAACRAWGRSRASVAIAYLHEDGSAYFDRAEFDEFEIDLIRDELRALMRRLGDARELLDAGNTMRLVQGDHCRYCPALTACPAQTALVRAVAGDPVEQCNPGELSETTARAAYQRIKAIKAALGKAEEALYLYGVSHPFELEPGVWFGPVRTEREYLDGAIARRVLAELHGQSVADAAVTWEATKTGVRKALQALAKERGEKLAPLERETLAAIRKAGGVDVSISESVREHKRKASDEEAA